MNGAYGQWGARGWGAEGGFSFASLEPKKPVRTVGGYAVNPGTRQRMEFRTVQGASGYVYRQWQNGDITIVVSSVNAKEKYLRAGRGTAWAAITQEIGAYPSASKPVARVAVVSPSEQAPIVSPPSLVDPPLDLVTSEHGEWWKYRYAMGAAGGGLLIALGLVIALSGNRR
jgi:hypothetical protein